MHAVLSEMVARDAAYINAVMETRGRCLFYWPLLLSAALVGTALRGEGVTVLVQIGLMQVVTAVVTAVVLYAFVWLVVRARCNRFSSLNEWFALYAALIGLLRWRPVEAAMTQDECDRLMVATHTTFHAEVQAIADPAERIATLTTLMQYSWRALVANETVALRCGSAH